MDLIFLKVFALVEKEIWMLWMGGILIRSNFSESEIGYIYRSIIWPIFFLSGGFIFFTENIFFKILGIEIILMQSITYIFHKKIIMNFGLLLFLIIISLWVTTFTSFYRYAYLAFLALFLQKIFNTKIRNKM